MQKIAAASNYADDSGCEVLIELRGSISECEVAAKCWLGMLVGGGGATTGTGAAVSEAGGISGTSGTNWAGPSK